MPNEAAEDAAQNIAGAAATIADTVQDKASQFTDRTRAAGARAVGTYFESSRAVAGAMTDLHRKATDAAGRSLSEVQNLSAQALQIRTLGDLANWQSNLIQHLQHDLSSATEIYSAAFNGMLSAYRPATAAEPLRDAA